MTIQIPDSLVYEDRCYDIRNFPLFQYIVITGKKKEDYINRIPSSACWRGYVAEWEVIGDRLYLVSSSDGPDSLLKQLFPNFDVRAFAHWYSGQIILGSSDYWDSRYTGQAEEISPEIVLVFRNGVIVDTRSEYIDEYEVALERFEVDKVEIVEYVGALDFKDTEKVYDPLGAVPEAPFGFLSPRFDGIGISALFKGGLRKFKIEVGSTELIQYSGQLVFPYEIRGLQIGTWRGKERLYISSFTNRY